MPDTLGIVLTSGDHARVHAAFLVAAGAAALGRRVVVFATGAGVHALTAGAAWPEQEVLLQTRGVAGIVELRAAARDLGVRLIACDSGLRGEAIEPAALLPGVTSEGLASFLEATQQAQMLSF